MATKDFGGTTTRSGERKTCPRQRGHGTRRRAMAVATALALASGCAGGCASLAPKTQPESLRETLTVATEFAQANNLQAIGHIEITDPGGELVQGVRISGVRGVIHFAANPGAPSKLDGVTGPKPWENPAKLGG